MPIPKMRFLEFLGEIAQVLFPDALFAQNHPALAFTLLTVGTIIYGYLMLDDYNVDNWKTGLKLIVFWFIVETLGSGFVVYAAHEGKTFSKLFGISRFGLAKSCSE